MTENLTVLAEVLDMAKQQGADDADAIFISGADISVGRRLGKMEEVERAESQAIGLRVIIDQRQAIVSASDITKDKLVILTERAVSMARQSPQDPYIGLAPNDILAQDIANLKLEDEAEPTTSWLFEQCTQAEEAALAISGITNSEGASAQFSRHKISLATSNGFAAEYGQTAITVSVSAIAGQGTNMERDYDYVQKRHLCDLPPVSDIGVSAAKKALARLGAKQVSSCQVPVIFDPRVGCTLLHNFLSAISGSAVARGTSFLRDKMGQQIFAADINIIDNPQIEKGLGSKPFDAEGVKGEKLELVKDGKLQHWLLNCRSANQLSLISNGRAQRSVSAAPLPAATNCYILPGKSTSQELISDIKAGFYVTDCFGMGVNIITGDYSQGAAGFWIENGEISYPVNEVTIAGRLQDMFMNITAADDLEFRYRSNTPTLRIDKMTVAGN